MGTVVELVAVVVAVVVVAMATNKNPVAAAAAAVVVVMGVPDSHGNCSNNMGCMVPDYGGSFFSPKIIKSPWKPTHRHKPYQKTARDYGGFLLRKKSPYAKSYDNR